MPDIIHLQAYARIVRNKSILRRIIVASQSAMNACLLETATPQAF